MTDTPEPVQPVRFGVLPAARRDVLQRALERARRSGAAAALVTDGTLEHVLENADVIVSLSWPDPAERLADARAALRAGKPVIVLETTATAEWPALDPQTWQPRGPGDAAPIAVSVDPRDEEHSLMLAILRLAHDDALRARLGGAAYAWAASQG